MTKPALMRPKAFELVGGLAVVTLVAVLVLARSGPRSTSAEQPETGKATAPAVVYHALPVRVPHEKGADRAEGERLSGAEMHEAQWQRAGN